MLSDFKQQQQKHHSQHPSHNHEDSQTKLQIAKLTQVIQKFFTKAAQIILESRAYPETSTPSLYPTKEESSKINKWFNLYMTNIPDSCRDDLKLWKAAGLTTIPPMIIETYLDLRNLPANQTLVLIDDEKHPWTVAKSRGKKQEVVLERWLIEFEPNTTDATVMVDELPLSYKQAIILFRSIYGFTRLMPAFKVKRNLQNKLPLGNKILDGNQPISSKGRIGLSKPIINTRANESHMTQKYFQPVHTSLGTLKISVAYRIDSEFCLHENEELLSTHFHKHDEEEETKKKVSSSVSPLSSGTSLKETSTSPRKSQPPIRIQPFKVGSMSTSPPVQSPALSQPGTATIQNQPSMPSSSLERRVSITSNKSTSNASLAAFLRNARSSTPSTNTIPIMNANPISGTSVPRSFSSSTGHEDSIFVNPDSASNTPRFASSFGSRASRRYSSTSIRQQTPQSDLMGHTNSVDAALSGIDVDDDDISDFVRMIDSKSDLRLGGGGGGSGGHSSVHNIGANESSYHGDALNKFQSMRSQYQQLSDSVSASLILQSRHSSRKSSLNSPAGSFDSRHHQQQQNQQQLQSQHTNIIASIHSYSHSRIKDARPKSEDHQQTKFSSARRSSNISPTTAVPSSTGTPSSINSRLPQVSTIISSSDVSSTGGNRTKSAATTAIVSGMATTPSIYDYRSPRYQNVFDDEEEDDNEEEEGHHEGHQSREGRDSTESSQNQSKRIMKHTKKDEEDSEDDEDLLFTMSDMNSRNF
ncbi:autophagy-related protein, putative [Candida dubliniensis CD36]|uniref:Autophagy-related protein 13 n=1 Tax=Candida dubliniensis (strain CD36 / ATCC MYA-646 / CBS 7987 / NCPF 3949 / NRRL Y-17841) TaxID=573826 RepID=B9WL93_CANDC|nr:autophagy-related protein, putative [Candida dubliniensis CD36]CAX39798.1 autophagy-related protein, putative [Candida dubliniensis CD36]